MNDLLKAFAFALQFLTRIPLPVSIEPDETVARRSLALFPAVGWLIGCSLYILCLFLIFPGRLSPMTVAIILVAAEAVITGAFHLDGLADTFDAFFSTAASAEKKLEIMKDSRIGVMGAVALILALLLKVALISECIRYDLKGAIAIYPAMGRLAQVSLYKYCTYVRPGGIGRLFSTAVNENIFCTAALLLVPCLLLQSWYLLAAVSFYCLFLAWYAFHAKHHIGGITGDVLGSATVLSEIAFLAGFPVAMFLESFFLKTILDFIS